MTNKVTIEIDESEPNQNDWYGIHLSWSEIMNQKADESRRKNNNENADS